MGNSTTIAPQFQHSYAVVNPPLTQSIRPEAEVYGICRIVPPDGWKPPFALDKDEFVFETRKQDLNQLEGQNRLRRQFFDMLSSFHTGRGVPMAKKRIQRREVDPYELHRLIQEFGGVDYVTEKRLWSNIGEAMGFDRMVCTSLGFQLREAYEVLLRPYEVFVAERKAENEKIRNEKNTIFKSKRVLANASASSLAARATKAVLPDSEKDSNELASGLKSNKRICPANRRRNNTEPTTSVDSVPRVSSAPRPRRAAQQLTYQSQCYNDGRDKAVVKKIYNSALSDNRLEIFESALGRLGSNKITSEIIRGLPMPKSGRNSPCFQSTAKPDGRQSHIPPQAQPLRQAQVRPQLLPCPQAQVQLPSRMQPQSEVQVRSDSQSQSQGQEQFIPVPMSEAKRQTQAQLQARPGVQVESHPQVQPKLQAQLQQQMPTQGTQTQPGDTQAHPQPQSQTLLRPQTPTQLQSEPQLTSQLQPQPKPQPQLQSQPQSQPQLQSQPKPQPQLQSQPQQLPQPQLQPQPHTHPQPQQGQAQPPISSQQQPQPQPQLQQSRLIGQSPPGQIQTRPHPHPLPPSQSHPHPDSQPQQQVQPCTDHINESPSVLKAIEVALRARRANSSVPVGGAIALPSKPQNSVSSASNISTAAQPQGLATKQAPTAAQNRLTPGAPPTQTPNLIPNPNQILNPNRVSNSNPNSNLNSKPTPHAQVNVGVQGYIRMPAAVPVYSHAQTHWQRAPVQPRMPFPRQAAVHPHTGLTAQTDIRPQQTGVRPHPGIPLQPGVRPLGFPHLSQHPPPRPHEPYMHAQAQLHYNAHMRAMQQHPLMRGPHPHPGVGMGHMPIMPVQYGMQRAPLCAQGVAGIAQKAGRSTNGMPLATAISPTETGGVKDNRANNGSSGNTKGGGKRKAEKTPTSKGAKGPKAKKRNRIRSDTGQGGVLVTSTRSGRTTKHLKSAYTCDLESSDSFDSDYGDMYEYVPAGTRKTPTAQKKRARTPTSTQKPTHQSPAPAQAMAKAQAAVQGSSIDHASSSPDHPTKANTNASVQRVTGRARGRVVSREGSLQPGEFCKACEQSHDDDQILLCDGGYGCNNGYHMYCLRPPLDRVPSGIWICPECLELVVPQVTSISPTHSSNNLSQYNPQRCKQAELDKDYSFGSGKTRRIKEFQIFADSFAAKVMGTDSPSIAEVEKQFWGLLNNPFHEMAVEYGADLHSKTLGSGFPCYSHRAALALDVTSIQEDLDRALLHMRWLKNVRDELQRKKWSQPNTVIALLNQGTAAHREGREMNQLKGVIGKYRQWKRNTAKAINHQSQNVDTLSALLDTRQTIPLAKCDLMLRLEDRVQITLSWNQRAEGLLAGRDGPVDLNDVRAHIHAGDCIKNMNLPLRIELAGLLRAPDQWFQQVKRTFCKKNTVASTTPEALVQQLQKRLTRSTQNILALRRTYARGSDDRLCVPDCRGEGFMVHCELCQNWYHGVCIKLRPHEVRVSRWFCRECKFANLRQPSEADVTRLVNEGSELNIKLPLLDTLGALLVKGSAWRARARAFLSKESDSELQSICIAMDMLDIDYHNERLLIEGRLKRLEARAEVQQATTVSKAQTKTKESATRLTVPKGISLQAIHSARTQTDSNHKAQVACVSQGPIDTQTASVLLDNLPTSRQGCEAVRDPCTATPASNAPCDVSGDARESGRTDDVTGTEDGDRVLDPKGGESLGQRGSEFGYLRQIGTNCSDRDRGNPKSLEAKTELPADIGIQQLTAILERAGATPEDEDRSISSEDEEEDDMDSARHCVCNLPYKTVEHDCMIQCERCDDWFHNTCVSVTEIQANRDTFVFICPGCIVGINPVAPTAAAAIVSIELPHYQVVPSYNKNTKADEPCPQQSTDTVC
ncbi:hypothetical protein SARC_00246 [Sphaeroforma arctica JP610]|uniref:Uncharacterized protein n=1 Tax=Sphaeroforma arctica JP610 TaxID=667725 RepID=A0A0L0GF61_9EUKA|nr:hypothetical protein SARC_00246 [Sphaeroforma arctica JP610]KNC87675.1 hypothetical protein SARC_00246 [Sphaeroforma arctica JP610]|eukprot:XP_014161577.1 hypothetical protein SARC_00246 [Sphaeroforma arctica JP610]